MHYYQFNISDYRADTAHLSIVEHGIYRQLIDWYYLDEKPIPKETQVVMRRLSLGSDSLHFLENVLSDFFIFTENGYCHRRIEEVIEHYRTQSAKNMVNGKLGGRPKKTQVVSERLAKQNPSKTQTKGNQELITNNHISTSLRSVDNRAKKSRSQISRPDDVAENVWEGFVAIRKAKRAPISQSAIDGIRRQATKANLTLGAALQICCERGWQGFSADWMNSNSKQSTNVQDARLDIANQIWGRGGNGTHNTIIDVESIRSIESDGAVIPKALAGIR